MRTFRVFALHAALALPIVLPAHAQQADAPPPDAAPQSPSQPGPADSQFKVEYRDGAIVSLRAANDTIDTNYIAEGQRLGDASVRFRNQGGEWRTAGTAALARGGRAGTTRSDDGKVYSATYSVAGQENTPALALRTQFTVEDDAARWKVTVENLTSEPLELSDFALPLSITREYGPPRGRGGRGDGERPPSGVILKHSLIAGNGSFLFWMRSNSVGPYLMMTPAEQTHFEFWDQQGISVAGAGEQGGGQRGPANILQPNQETATATDTPPTGQGQTVDSGQQPAAEGVRDEGRGRGRGRGRGQGGGQRRGGRRGRSYNLYVHSTQAGAVAGERGTKWRMPHTGITLAPRGDAGDSITYGYTLRWAADYDAVRQMLVDHGLIDVHVVPGMTVPSDLFAQFALRMKQEIHAIEPEYPFHTRIEPQGANGDYQLFKVRFSKLGENRLTVRFGNNREMYLEFFATEPLETLIKKRAAFLAKSQHRDESKWYNGLITDWNMRDKVLISPDNHDLIPRGRVYAITCDDPGLGKPAFLASKLAEYPLQSEVDALDYYIEHFVWGGLQRTTDETFPYGIYGIPDWKSNRDSDNPEAEGPTAQLKLWRPYDYPHIITMYYQMYRLAKNHPHIKTKLTAHDYLRRAHGTAKAMFTVPLETRRWSPYGTGFYNEVTIVSLIDDLEAEGMKEEAAEIRAVWERKVNSFVSGRQDLFRSEYAFDSTGFESTHALAKYALKNPQQLAERYENFNSENADRFMHAQMAANLFCRGTIEPAYYLLGSDYRGGGGNGYVLTYMAQMGGWSVLDYGLNYAARPDSYLRLGYASYLSAWALMNTGTPESNYGYWFPGQENDGGAGGGFEPSAYGQTWLGQPHHRGSWLYSCEIDLGYCGALRTAATLLADDEIFGRVCYGGDWRATFAGLEVTPKDGLRRRFYAMLDGGKLQLVLDSDRFAAGQPLVLKEDLSQLRFQLESDNRAEHTTKFRLTGWRPGKFRLRGGATDVEFEVATTADGEPIRETIMEVTVPAASDAPTQIAIERVAG
jgi:hypothetical protein